MDVRAGRAENGRLRRNVEYARVSPVFGDALVAALGLGHHEFAVHFGDFRIQSGFVGNAMQTLDLGMFTLVIGRREARTRLEHTHLRRI